MREPLRRLTRLIFLVGGLVLASVRAADACTCIASGCGDLANADAVFEATVVSIEESPGVVTTDNAASASFMNGGGMNVVMLKDVRGWRGETPTVIHTGLGGGDCGYEFHAGERYLIQASRSSDGQFSTGICSLIRKIKDAAPLIEYLQALKVAPAQTRVIGTVARITGWRADGIDLQPIGDAQVVLSGTKRVTLSTSPEGRFVATGLPEGMYQVTVRVAGRTLPANREWSEFLLGRDGQLCEELSIEVPANGRAEIAVVDENGIPVKGAFVHLSSADQIDPDGDRPGAGVTLPEGKDLITGIPPGRYLIEMNPWNGPTPGGPFLQASSPVFVVEDNKTATPPPLRVRRATKIAVSGIVRDGNGAPVAGVLVQPWIQLINGKRSTDWPHPKTDAEGRFEVQLWKDQRYVVTLESEDDPRGRIEFIADGRPIAITARPR